MTELFTAPPPPGAPGPEHEQSLIAKEVIPNVLGGQYVGGGSSGVLISVHPSVGPGYLELSSPDAYCEFTLQESSDLISFDRRLRTGPASYSGVYLPSGGIVRFRTIGAPLQGHIINDDNGVVDFTARPDVKIRGRFYIGLDARPKTEPSRFVDFDVGPVADFPPIPAAAVVNVAFPPHYCRYFVVSTDFPFQVDTVTETGTVRASTNLVQLRLSFPILPWSFVRFTGLAAPTVAPALQWVENGDVFV